MFAMLLVRVYRRRASPADVAFASGRELN